MNRKRLGIILVVVGALLALAVGVVVYLQTEQAAQIAKQTPTVEVVVAVADLPERVAVPETGVAITKVPADLVPVEAATKLQDVVGKFPLTRIYKSEILIRSKLADTTGKTGPAFALKEGMVLVTYAGGDLLNATGAIRAGDRVDMLLTLPLPKVSATPQPAGGQAAAGQPGGAQAGPLFPQVTQTFMQNLEVIRVGAYPAAGQADAGGGGSKTVTFQVSHQDALVLEWVKNSGGIIDLVLRHPAEKEPVATEAITANYVFRNFKFVFAEPITAVP